MILSFIQSFVLAQTMNLNAGIPLIKMPDGGTAARIWVENATVTQTVNVSGGGGSGGSGAPVDGGYLTITAGSTGSTNESVLTAGANISITPGAGTATVAVTGTVPNATAAVTATSANTATALASNPADCSAGQYATTIAASGDLTCSQVAYSQVSGTPTIPTDISAAGYITKTAEANLSNEFAMGSLGTGIVKNTTTTGVPTIAISGTDYAPATSGSAILKGNGAGGFSAAVSGTDYDADATGAVTGGIRLTGDLGGTAASPSVVDDSHAHTGTTISALDTGDITTGTLAAARGGLGAAQPTCSGGDFLTCNGTTCSCATPAGGGGGLAHAAVQRLVFLGQ